MNTGGEVAGIVANVYAELGKKGLELGSKLLSYILLAMLKSVERKLNTGEVSMKKLLESGEELKQIKINIKDSELLATKAVEAGVMFAFLDKNPNDDKYTLVFKAKDIEIINALMEKIRDGKIKSISSDKSIIDEFLVGGGKDMFIVDNNNPLNYIATKTERQEHINGYFINPYDPDRFIKFEENIKENSLSIEVYNKGEIAKYDTSEFKYADIKNKICDISEKWGGIELVDNEDDRAKYKDKLIQKAKEKEERGDKKTVKEVEREVKKIRNNQPSKDRKAKDKTKAKTEKEKGR